MRFIRLASAFLIGLFLVACGGGGSDAGTSPFVTGSGSTGTGTTTATPSLLLSISSTTASGAAPATVTASLKDASGAGIAGQVITFSTVGSLGAFNVNSALTDANGDAAVKLTPASSASNGADLVLAKTTVGSASLAQTIGFQVTPGSASVTPAGGPSVSIALSATAVSTTAPATVTAVVKDATGAGISGQIVRFSTASTGLGTFDVTTALTDSTGTARSTLNAASTTAKGADLAIAQVTVNGALVTGSVGFSVASAASVSAGAPSIALSLSTNTVTTGTPATVTAVVKDASGAGVVNQVVKFRTVDGLGSLTVASALTDSVGAASTTLTATSAIQSGADQVVATATVNGSSLQASQGFRLTAVSAAIASVTAQPSSIGSYGQTAIHVALSGTVAGSPVAVSITSACIAAGKATLTPSTASTTNGAADFTYRDAGCGATTSADTLQASIVGSAATGSLSLAIAAPTANSINFISASPTSIYLKGSGFTETSIVTFRVLDTAGNGLPGQDVLLQATTLAGGLTINSGPGKDGTMDVVRSDSLGNVTARINSGTVPTPVRITASLVATPAITTVSSALGIAVGVPSQLNFSLSQGTINIEGFSVDGVTNTYSIIASDRLGNPVPAGTSVNFVTEGGQIEAIKQTTIDGNGNARTTANFISSSPRPADGRVTVLAYSLGEESFLDLNGNNIRDSATEPFQDLGSVYLDRLYNGHYNAGTDQFITLALPAAVQAACATTTSPLLALDVSIPSIPSTPSFAGFVAPPGGTSCDGVWGKAYVRRAVETVLSTSSARPVWNSVPTELYSTTGGACPSTSLIVGYTADETPVSSSYVLVGAGGTALYNAASTFAFLASDANPIRLNPMPAGTTISAAGTTGLTVTLIGGSPVPSTPSASGAAFTVVFAAGVTSGTVTLNLTSPRNVITTVTLPVFAGPPPAGAHHCP